ncbi:segregation/condensation protein B [Oceanirhabdus seepicola]|uniref:Segregation and condensation protein B n=2 Tax=Oceanirhabdus seepicola TaxID=2828781 RepID=A0A9J6P9I2_9CLOT|nr:SMC-Scp complex subunit ScpB [Oceanirhabdus seepicola]MCM1992764.1 segregation/condensation protein B [Oceanirhabdus seepicola]
MIMDNEFYQMQIGEEETKVRYYSVVESLLFVKGDPLSFKEICDVLDCSEAFVKKLMDDLIELKNKDKKSGIKIIKIKDCYQMVTKTENSDFIRMLLKTNTRQSLSQAALETLAIVAYKQPITKVEMEDIRGVKCDRAVYTLVEKKLIKESGRKEVPGRPILYGTTDEFLRHFELESLGLLPNLDEFEIEEDFHKEIEEQLEKENLSDYETKDIMEVAADFEE